MTTSTSTTGTVTGRDEIERLLSGGCVFCGKAHSGFGHDQRAGLRLAACGCGAIYQYRNGALPPATIMWYRSLSRTRKSTA